MNEISNTSIKLSCYHCGQDCPDDSIQIEDKNFCCNGCKTVYEILNQNQLCSYYNFENNPGISPASVSDKRYDYLDEPDVIEKLTDFRDDKYASLTFYIPQMHCSSCIWLLENLYKLNSAIVLSKVNFVRKELNVRYLHEKLSLKELVKLLASIGYEPQISLDSVESKKEKHPNRQLYYKIGIAGFAFGNIMLFSFPEYFSIDITETFLKKFFSYLNLILALPVFFYSASDYFISAFKGLRKKVINIDVPISLGILVLFIRSAYEILFSVGPGYFDSMTGLVFFLLIGKILQEKTYDALNFERDYKAYFPLSVTIKQNENEKSIPISKLMIGNRILVRKNEIIPADSILINGEGIIDYSFVTGESHPVSKVSGEMIFAGGRQLGSAIELEVIKEVSQSYLTRLWNNDTFNKAGESYFTRFSNTVSKYFTIIVLLIAIGAGSYWLTVDLKTALHVFTSVLIVACPCALALSTPFTLGNAMRILGRNKFYLKNSSVIEEMAKVNEIVFDKTGTITESGKADIIFHGKVLTAFEQKLVKSLVRNSTHPLSKRIYDSIDLNEVFLVTKLEEKPGFGISGVIYGNELKLGSAKFVGEEKDIDENLQTKIHLSINGQVVGKFIIANSYREGISDVIKKLSLDYHLSLLSGDNEGEKSTLENFFGKNSKLNFHQSPEDKLIYVKEQQQKGKKVLMLGDGLNDAGALSQSDVGIAVTNDISNFSPACDAILHGSELKKIPQFLAYSKDSIKIIYASFVISFLYNLIGLSFAVEAMLSPILAAILMPVSSISVVLFATVMTNIFGKKRGLSSKLL
ncbi:Cation transport ATPase [Ignavibacterium album JCM 16511]|uniref:Cation transport ATPase n=1 Tax=Ignavibacterium album (strain DSM 19864 / JCM 16511 / NBRC 101810 / Mat9-16) TaxID=945713 RepID=I0AHH5_IGNAJ|nr:heavy metal translocating P-type ATPase metal-binding domain-containing protein [Ignavibacterium album]AFH48432.1 Cation transport ATPase [Ignavibacterium album JCM 16511]